MTKSTTTIDHKIAIEFLIPMSHAICCSKHGLSLSARWLGRDRSRISRGKLFNE
jgi:hypothetical protein